MAKDLLGNYICGVTMQEPYPLPQSPASGLVSDGVPDDAVGRDGATCVDQASGGLYAKWLGVWRFVKSLV